MLLQPDKSDFILVIINEVEAHESRSRLTLMKNSEVNNKHKNKDGKLKTILSIFSFKSKRFPDRILMKHKSRRCAHGGIQKWGVNHYKNYAPVVNWIGVRFLLAIAIINELTSISIDFVLAFPQADLDLDVFMELFPGIWVVGNRVEWVINF